MSFSVLVTANIVPEDGTDIFLQNFGSNKTHTVLHPTRWHSACQKDDSNRFPVQEKDGGIHASSDHNLRNVLQVNEKSSILPFRTKAIDCSSMTITVCCLQSITGGSLQLGFV
jgi:hypothetical protein